MRAATGAYRKSASLAHSPAPSSASTPSSTLLSPSWIWPLVNMLLLVAVTSATSPPWHAPGCHMLGHTRRVALPSPVPGYGVYVNVTTNACRGFCRSYAIPATSEILQSFGKKIVSRAECCSISETHDVHVIIHAPTGSGYEPVTHTFRSARSCRCSGCRRG